MNPSRNKAPRGFTLVEILIVVIILGILAGIVIPQFANATEDARKTSMAGMLQTLKSTVELYRIQHRDQPPDLITNQWSQIVSSTDVDGTVNPSGKLGPYLPKAPVNSLTASSTIVQINAAAATTNGWFYDPATGELHGATRAGEKSDDGTTVIP